MDAMTVVAVGHVIATIVEGLAGPEDVAADVDLEPSSMLDRQPSSVGAFNPARPCFRGSPGGPPRPAVDAASASFLCRPAAPAGATRRCADDHWLWPTLHRFNVQLRVWTNYARGSHTPSRPDPPVTDQSVLRLVPG
jgi:hypothetical protein